MLRRLLTLSIALVPLVILASFSLRTELIYINHSEGFTGKSGASFVEIPQASETRLVERLKNLARTTTQPVIVSDTHNKVLAKFESFYTKGKVMVFPAFELVGGVTLNSGFKLLLDSFFRGRQADVYTLLEQQSSRFVGANFYFKKNYKYAQTHRFVSGGTPDHTLFSVDKELTVSRRDESRMALYEATSQQSIINRLTITPSNVGLIVKPLAEVSNHLVFVDSTLGQIPKFGSQRFAAIYQLEPDYFLPKSTMAGLGRYLLFEVLNPTPTMRVVLDISTSLKGRGAPPIPRSVTVMGTKLVALKAEGRGAARLISAPITPQTIMGQHYIGIDMGIAGSLFPEQRTQLMRLYNTNIPLDGRRLVAFARNISAVSEPQFQRMPTVSSLSTFPTDLFRGERGFSGVYEDGWISEKARITLKQRHPGDFLVLRGLIPLVDNKSFVTTLTVRLDGKTLGSRDLSLGEFSLKIPSAKSGLHDVELQFSRSQRLPGGDGRVVTMKTAFVGFTSAKDASP